MTKKRNEDMDLGSDAPAEPEAPVLRAAPGRRLPDKADVAQLARELREWHVAGENDYGHRHPRDIAAIRRVALFLTALEEAL